MAYIALIVELGNKIWFLTLLAFCAITAFRASEYTLIAKIAVCRILRVYIVAFITKTALRSSAQPAVGLTGTALVIIKIESYITKFALSWDTSNTICSNYYTPNAFFLRQKIIVKTIQTSTQITRFTVRVIILAAQTSAINQWISQLTPTAFTSVTSHTPLAEIFTRNTLSIQQKIPSSALTTIGWVARATVLAEEGAIYTASLKRW